MHTARIDLPDLDRLERQAMAKFCSDLTPEDYSSSSGSRSATTYCGAAFD